MTGGTGRGVGGLRHGTAEFEGVAAGPAAVLVTRHGDRLIRDSGSKDGSKDHTVIVTYKSGGVPYVTHHSNNTLRRSVASLVASYPNAYYYAYRT
jgi:hypothetical protein